MNYYQTRPFFRKLTKTWEKDFKKLSKGHKELEKTLQDKTNVSLDKSTHTCNACETFKEKESKLCLENETIAKKNLLYWRTFRSWKTNWKVYKRIWRNSMNFMIIKVKRDMIYGKNVHKHTNYKYLKKVNIIFGWNVKNIKDL